MHHTILSRRSASRLSHSWIPTQPRHRPVCIRRPKPREEVILILPIRIIPIRHESRCRTRTRPRSLIPPRTHPRPNPRHKRVLILVRRGDLRRLLASAREHGRGVAGALAAPEPRCVVVRGGDEDVAEGVEGERPDVGVVRLRERRARAGLGRCHGGEELGGGRGGRGGHVPVEDCAF